MPSPASPRDPRARLRISVRVLGILTGISALWLVLAAWMVLSSVMSPGPGEPGYGSGDPHGYAAVFGFLLGLVALLALMVFGLPWWRLRQRYRDGAG